MSEELQKCPESAKTRWEVTQGSARDQADLASFERFANRYAKEDIEQFVKKDGGLILRRGHEVAGYVGYRVIDLREQKVLYIDRLYVSPTARNPGVIRSLVRGLQDTAARNNVAHFCWVPANMMTRISERITPKEKDSLYLVVPVEQLDVREVFEKL